MAEPTIAETAEQYREAAKEAVAGGLEAVAQSDVMKFFAAAIADIIGTLLKVGFTTLGPVGEGLMRGISESEDQLAPLLARYATAAVNDIFGTNVSEAQFSRLRGGSARTVAGPVLGQALMAQMGAGHTGQLEPGDAAASKYLGAVAGAAIEDWFKGWFFEVISSMVPLDVGKIEKYGGLADKVGTVMGLNGVSSRVLRPLVETTIITPLRWQLAKQHRPELLSPSECARQILRGFGDKATWLEHMRRQGHSEANIEALLASQGKVFSPSDVRTFVYRGHWSNDEGLKHLRDQGYDEKAATDALRLEGLRRIDQLEAAEASVIIAAYANREIDHATFQGAMQSAVTPQAERELLTELAELRRSMNVKRLTAPQVAGMVEDEILSFADYREALEREGYPDLDVVALELSLRRKIDKAKSVAEHRAELEAARAEAKRLRDEAAAARKVALEAERGLRRRGAAARLEAMAIRGLIPIARVEEVYAAQFDPDTVRAYVDDLTDRRADYVDDQAAAERARARAAIRSVDVGQLERTVVAGVLTLDEFRRRLDDLGFTPADAALLTEALDARLRATADAQADRDAAAAAAKVRRIDLGRYELLVRRGHRTMAEYDVLLESFGFDEGSRAAMRELLQITIDDDTAAAALRAEAEARLRAKGLSLEQFRRAVILGVRPIADYAPFLLANGFAADAIATLVPSLQVDADEAAAARARRAEADRRTQAGRAPLADVRRAARLGLIGVDAYVARMKADGFPADDIDLEVDLLAQELADIQTARLERQVAATIAQNRPIGLAAQERAVRAGLDTIPSYVAAARAAGYSQQAAELLGALLEQEIAAAAAAVKHVSTAQLENAVLVGVATLDQYDRTLRALGYADDDVQLLGRLLADRVARQEAARARQAAIDAADQVKAATRADFAKGVLEGLRTPEAYATYLAGAGYPPDDVALLVDLVKAQRARTVAAAARRLELDAADSVRALARTDVAKGVRAGLRSPQEYADWLTAQGYADDDVTLLVDLVLIELQEAADEAAEGAP